MSAFTVTVSGNYVRDEIPPRCRKPRPVSHEATATYDVPQVSADDAPVAFKVERAIAEKVEQIRTHGGNLYARYLPWAHQEEPSIPGSDHFPAEVDGDRYHSFLSRPESAEEFEQNVQDHYGNFLIIDGEVWVATSEPRYVVMTFGLGNNHGGTGLMDSSSDNQNIMATSYFRADEYEQARQHAIQVASRRGDTEDVARFEKNPESYRSIEVVIPDAVTLVTMLPESEEARDLRFDYWSAVRKLKDSDGNGIEEEEQAFSKVAVLRAKLIDLGVPVQEPTARPYEARHSVMA